MPTLTLAVANEIVARSFERSAALGYRPMAVVVVDNGGHIVSAQRQDGATMFRIDVARGKAWASVAMGVSSRALVQRAKDQPHFFTALATVGDGKFVPQTGGVLIRDDQGLVLGAAGASGGTGDEDEAICMHGIEAAGLVAG